MPSFDALKINDCLLLIVLEFANLIWIFSVSFLAVPHTCLSVIL